MKNFRNPAAIAGAITRAVTGATTGATINTTTKVIITVITGALLCGLLCTTPVLAASCGGVDTAIVSCDQGSGVSIVLRLVINIMTVALVVVAVIGIVVSGIQYLTAGDKEEQVRKSKRRLFEIVIGLAIWAALYAIVSFLMPGDVQNTIEVIESTEQEATEQATERAAQEAQRRAEQEAQRQAQQESQQESQQSTERQTTIPSSVTVTIEDKTYNGATYRVATATANSAPFVYAPNNGYGASRATALNNLKSTNALAAINAGTFNMANGANNKASGVVIVNGEVITSNTSGVKLVFDKAGRQPGWAANGVSAADLVAGTATYYDIHGNAVTGQIYNAVTNFAPILIDGKAADGSESTWNFSNASSHYSALRSRQMLCIKENSNSSLTYSFITNINDQNSKAWNFSGMVGVSKYEGCTFSFNLDGGGSTLLASRSDTTSDFATYGGARAVPTYLVFTSDNQAP